MMKEKKVKRIWMLNHHAETPQTGAGTRHYDFARELIKRGYEVTIFASSNVHYTDINILEDGEKYKITDEDGIQWVWMNTLSYTSNGLRRIVGMIQYYVKVLKITKTLEAPDLVIGSAVHLLACLAGYQLSKRYKTQFVSEIRDLWPETLIQMGKLKRSSPIAKAMNALEDYIYRKSDNIIITAPGMAEYIQGTGISNSKIVYINNGIDTVCFDERYQTVYEEDDKCKLDLDKFNAVYAGGHGLANDLETAIEAAKIVQDEGYGDICFTFFGEGPLKESLIKKAQELSLNNIEFRDLVPKYCVPKILCNADALLVMLKNLTLYKYGMSMNKVFEYLYSGTPIVFALNVPNDYVAETGDGYSIEPENPEAMARAIIKIYDSTREERQIMGQKGKTFVKANFDIPVLVNKLEEICIPK